MGHRTNRKHSRRSVSDTESDAESSSPSPSGSDDEGTSFNKRRRSHRKERSSSRRERGKKREGEKREKRRRDREKERRQSRREERRRVRKRARDSDDGRSSARSDSEAERACAEPESVLRDMLAEFPNVASDLKQLLQMIDGGQAVDVNGISERILIKHLKKLFRSLELKEKDGVFMLPSNSSPVLMVVGPMIDAHVVHNEKNLEQTQEVKNLEPEHEHGKGVKDDITEAGPSVRRRVIGPEMPSAELLAAAAKLTEAQAEMRDAELEEDTELFIGPAPPAVAAEAESANEAERFEEVTRIMGADVDNPYDVVGVNHKMAAENMKKRYWKLSLLVHPDKCSHPQAHQAFIRLNKAFKDLQDPDKRKVLDDKIKQKEEEEAFKIELKAMREAAQWRRLQGISMEGDDELLADMHVKEEMPKRDEWMTTLPPERKAGVTMQSTRFSKGSKEGRGDTSAWTDTPSDRAQKAKMNYLEAYNEATALASNEEEQKTMKADAELVDMYNKTKRSKSLVQKHQEESTSRSKKKSKQQQPQEKEEWVGKHPWKPWDRETDLVAGRQSVKFDSESMGEGLASRFSSGTFQRNFL